MVVVVVVVVSVVAGFLVDGARLGAHVLGAATRHICPCWSHMSGHAHARLVRAFAEPCAPVSKADGHCMLIVQTHGQQRLGWLCRSEEALHCQWFSQQHAVLTVSVRELSLQARNVRLASITRYLPTYLPIRDTYISKELHKQHAA